MVTPDHIAVAVIVCAALAYLVTQLRKKKGVDCCGNKITQKGLPSCCAAKPRRPLPFEIKR